MSLEEIAFVTVILLSLLAVAAHVAVTTVAPFYPADPGVYDGGPATGLP